MGLERVQEVHYIRTFWDRLIGTGSLDVVNAGDQEQEHVGFLRKDQEFRDALQQAIEMRQAELREDAAPGGL
jgi:hypothetical protein